MGICTRKAGRLGQGSFSAVSKPIVATKHSLENSRRDLHNALRSTDLQCQMFVKIHLNVARFYEHSYICLIFAKFRYITEFRQNSLNFSVKSKHLTPTVPGRATESKNPTPTVPDRSLGTPNSANSAASVS